MATSNLFQFSESFEDMNFWRWMPFMEDFVSFIDSLHDTFKLAVYKCEVALQCGTI